ncbi:MAG: hypothetical protein ACI4LO_00270 [Anaerovoracaceae bacterium]
MPKKEVLKNNNDQYSADIMEAVEELLDESRFQNKHVLNKIYTPNELFEVILEYEGLSGYGMKIKKWIKELYGIDLDAVES